MIRAIVFDMDGVLVDSTTSHALAFQEVLQGIGVGGFDYSQYAGERTPDVFRKIRAERGLKLSETEINVLADTKSARARQLLSENDCFMPDYKLVLERLAEHFVLALASSGSRSSVDDFLDRGGARKLFRSVLSGSDVENAKPDPEIYLRSFLQLECQPEECAVVEDALSGVLAAKRAGAGRIIGFHPKRDGGSELLTAGAAPVIGMLRELLELFAVPPGGVKISCQPGLF
ncbi:HAD family hydrolase [Bryobacter aggregatus]|uniref:HAD family hydrolase n=1 Tax=Bryobacter aggregatus TaxID=360054 RepID=UPI0004E190EC|nr:HAD family phosphatase [Bryobacter aggregatus]